MILLGQHKPRLLDLFCGGGGATEGYVRSGFIVHGIDKYSQPNYPYTFTRCDALEYLQVNGHLYDAIHASPVCQHHSWAAARWRNDPEYQVDYDDDLLIPIRDALIQLGKPFSNENNRHTLDPDNAITLCGEQFPGLRVFRHRLFETNWMCFAPSKCRHTHKIGFGENDFVSVAGHGANGSNRYDNWCNAMGIHWMTKRELTQSIPPAYTEWIGRQLRRLL